MRFAYPQFLFLLILVPILIWLFFKKKINLNGYINYSDTKLFKLFIKNNKVFNKEKFLIILRIFTLILLIFVISRPQAGQKSEEILSKGYDIILCLDTSSSMKAEDFKPKNRLHVAKEVVKKFISGRKHDRIGIVVFAAIAFTQAPLTLDYGALDDFVNNTEIGMTQSDGTAIGTAILTCVKRLEKSKAKSKIIILLTDGRSNMGEVDPITASKAAEALNIKIYTIGVGVPGGALYPVDHPIFGRQYVKMKEDLDEETLTQIAINTDGRYFRATSEQNLFKIYERINKMEKSEIKIKEYTKYKELYRWFLFPCFFVFFIELVLRYVIWKKIP